MPKSGKNSSEKFTNPSTSTRKPHPPEDDGQAFDTLAKEGIISNELADNLKRAKGMRNVIAHQYGGINDEMVFDAISTELMKDAKTFVRQKRKAG